MEEYDKHHLFRWNENNLLITNENNYYEDILIHTGTIIKGEWENPICVSKIDDKLFKVVSNSNYFLHGIQWPVWYDNAYKIYTNLVRNYLEIKNQQINYSYYNNDTIYFYMLDAFCFSNSGHNLSVMLNNAKYIIDNNIKNILIYKKYIDVHNYKFIKLILPSDCNFIELDENTIYKIQKIIIIEPDIYDILKHRDLIHNLKNIINNNYSSIYDDCKNKNIILIKSNRNKNVMLEYTRIHCEKLLCNLENNGFINLIPEDIDVFKLAIYIMYAKNIIFSEGAIVFTNKIFVNNTTNLFGIYNPNGSFDFNFNGLINLHHIRIEQNILKDEDCLTIYNQIIDNLQ
jgi:hypothetical protein